MNIFTKRGDAGKTSLYGGAEVSKDDLRVWCYGTVDETNSALAIAHASLEFDDLKAIVREIQNKLFSVGAELASDEKQRAKEGARITDADVSRLEGIITGYTEDFGKVMGFTLPGETPVSASLHLARAIARRAERHVVSLSRDEHVSPALLKYLNRLSDTLFVLAKIEVYRNFIKRVVDKLRELQAGAGAGGDAHFAAGAQNGEIVFCADLCDRLKNAALFESLGIGAPVSLAILDKGGNLVYFCRFPGASLVSVDVAQKKAYTAVSLEKPSGDLYDAVSPGGDFHGLNTVDPRFVFFGGGFPLFARGVLVGGIGVSGGSIQEDEQIGRRVVAELERYIK